MACCDGSNDQGNRNQKKKDQKEKYDPLRRVNHGMTQTVDYVATVLTDTALLSIVSDFYNPALVRILTLKSAWLRAHIVFVHRHRSAASLKLLGHDGDWSETVQLAARREYDVRSTWESSTQVGSSLAVSRVPVASQGQSEGFISPKKFIGRGEPVGDDCGGFSGDRG